MNKYYFLFFIFFTLLLSACGKKAVGIKSASTSTLENFKVDNVDFRYLTTSSRIKFSDDNKKMSATANIRMKKDSIIWISITPGFGIEAARGLITRDSLIFINRLDREYSAYNFQDLSREFNFDINFDLVQSVLLGNMMVEVSSDDKIKKEPKYFVVHQEEGTLFIENFVDAQTLKLERVAIVEKEKNDEFGKKVNNNTLNLSYSDFQLLEEKILPFENMVSLDYQRHGQKKRTEINIQHKKANFTDEALRFPFSIPEKYARR